MDKEVIVLQGNFMDAYGLSFAMLVPDGQGGYEAEGLEDLQSHLNKGYEPFAVTPYMMAPKPGGILGSPTQRAPMMCDKIWLRLKVRVQKDESPLPETPKTS